MREKIVSIKYLSIWVGCSRPDRKKDAEMLSYYLECYATPWPLWRENRILWHIVEPSLPPSLLSLFCL